MPDASITSSVASDDPPRRRLLITAGPTHEPIDSVRFIGNRSSGRLGIALAEEAARRDWNVRVLLGPTCLPEPKSPIEVSRFRTTAELQALLKSSSLPDSPQARGNQVVIMAAAVADFRPKSSVMGGAGKLRRTEAGLTLDLEPTPDLLAELGARASEGAAGQFLVGFALEPRATLLTSALEKLRRKNVDLIVANPLETMDSERIEAVVLDRAGEEHRPPAPGEMSKSSFAAWLLDLIDSQLRANALGD